MHVHKLKIRVESCHCKQVKENSLAGRQCTSPCSESSETAFGSLDEMQATNQGGGEGGGEGAAYTKPSRHTLTHYPLHAGVSKSDFQMWGYVFRIAESGGVGLVVHCPSTKALEVVRAHPVFDRAQGWDGRWACY